MSTDAKTRLAEIRALVERATPGPWRVLPVDEWCLANGNTNGISSLPYDNADIVKTDAGMNPPNQADAAFIASARTDIPWLLERIAHLEWLVKEAEWSGCIGRYSEAACPWCAAGWRQVGDKSLHRADCPAFTVNCELK